MMALLAQLIAILWTAGGFFGLCYGYLLSGTWKIKAGDADLSPIVMYVVGMIVFWIMSEVLEDKRIEREKNKGVYKGKKDG